MSSVRQKRNKPENPFQNYDLAIKLFRSTKEIFLYKKYFNATIRSTKEIFLYKKYFNATIRSEVQKTGNRKENLTPDYPENFYWQMNW